MFKHYLHFVMLLVVLASAGCANQPTQTTREAPAAEAAHDWTVITDIEQIAADRKALSKPNFDLGQLISVRLTSGGQTLEVTSLAPSIIGKQVKGAPAAKTTFAFTPERDTLVLFTQDVPAHKAFRKDMPVSELVSGKSFEFPVVQSSGEIKIQKFTVDRVIER